MPRDYDDYDDYEEDEEDEGEEEEEQPHVEEDPTPELIEEPEKQSSEKSSESEGSSKLIDILSGEDSGETGWDSVYDSERLSKQYPPREYKSPELSPEEKHEVEIGTEIARTRDYGLKHADYREVRQNKKAHTTPYQEKTMFMTDEEKAAYDRSLMETEFARREGAQIPVEDRANIGNKQIRVNYAGFKSHKDAAAFLGTLDDDKSRMTVAKEYCKYAGIDLTAFIGYAENMYHDRLFATPQSDRAKTNAIAQMANGLNLTDADGNVADFTRIRTKAEADRFLYSTADPALRKKAINYLNALAKIESSSLYGYTFSTGDYTFAGSAELSADEYKKATAKFDAQFYASSGHQEENIEKFIELAAGITSGNVNGARIQDNDYARDQVYRALQSAYEQQTGYKAPAIDEIADLIQQYNEMSTADTEKKGNWATDLIQKLFTGNDTGNQMLDDILNGTDADLEAETEAAKGKKKSSRSGGKGGGGGGGGAVSNESLTADIPEIQSVTLTASTGYDPGKTLGKGDEQGSILQDLGSPAAVGASGGTADETAVAAAVYGPEKPVAEAQASGAPMTLTEKYEGWKGGRYDPSIAEAIEMGLDNADSIKLSNFMTTGYKDQSALGNLGFDTEVEVDPLHPESGISQNDSHYATRVFGSHIGRVAEEIRSAKMQGEAGSTAQIALQSLLRDVDNVISRDPYFKMKISDSGQNARDYVINNYRDADGNPVFKNQLYSILGSINDYRDAQKAPVLKAQDDINDAVEQAKTAVAEGHATPDQYMLAAEHDDGPMMPYGAIEDVLGRRGSNDATWGKYFSGICASDAFDSDSQLWKSSEYFASEYNTAMSRNNTASAEMYAEALREEAIYELEQLASAAIHANIPLEKYMSGLGISGPEQLVQHAYNQLLEAGSMSDDDKSLIDAVAAGKYDGAKIGFFRAAGFGVISGAAGITSDALGAPGTVVDALNHQNDVNRLTSEWTQKYGWKAPWAYATALNAYIDESLKNGSMSQTTGAELKNALAQTDNVFDITYDMDPGWLERFYRGLVESPKKVQDDMNAIGQYLSGAERFAFGAGSTTAYSLIGMTAAALTSAGLGAAGITGAAANLGGAIVGFGAAEMNREYHDLRYNGGYSNELALGLSSLRGLAIAAVNMGGTQNAVDLYMGNHGLQMAFNDAVRHRSLPNLLRLAQTVAPAIHREGMEEVSEELITRGPYALIADVATRVEKGEALTASLVIDSTLKSLRGLTSGDALGAYASAYAGGAAMSLMFNVAGYAKMNIAAHGIVKLENQYQNSVGLASQMVRGEVEATPENLQRFMDGLEHDMQDPVFRKVIDQQGQASRFVNNAVSTVMLGQDLDIRGRAVDAAKKAASSQDAVDSATDAYNKAHNDFLAARQALLTNGATKEAIKNLEESYNTMSAAAKTANSTSALNQRAHDEASRAAQEYFGQLSALAGQLDSANLHRAVEWLQNQKAVVLDSVNRIIEAQETAAAAKRQAAEHEAATAAAEEATRQREQARIADQRRIVEESADRRLEEEYTGPELAEEQEPSEFADYDDESLVSQIHQLNEDSESYDYDSQQHADDAERIERNRAQIEENRARADAIQDELLRRYRDVTGRLQTLLDVNGREADEGVASLEEEAVELYARLEDAGVDMDQVSLPAVSEGETTPEDVKTPEPEKITSPDVDNPQQDEITAPDVNNPRPEETTSQDVDNPRPEETTSQDVNNPRPEETTSQDVNNPQQDEITASDVNNHQPEDTEERLYQDLPDDELKGTLQEALDVWERMTEAEQESSTGQSILEVMTELQKELFLREQEAETRLPTEENERAIAEEAQAIENERARVYGDQAALVLEAEGRYRGRAILADETARQEIQNRFGVPYSRWGLQNGFRLTADRTKANISIDQIGVEMEDMLRQAGVEYDPGHAYEALLWLRSEAQKIRQGRASLDERERALNERISDINRARQEDTGLSLEEKEARYNQAVAELDKLRQQLNEKYGDKQARLEELHRGRYYLTPEEVAEVRAQYGSLANFAKETGIKATKVQHDGDKTLESSGYRSARSFLQDAKARTAYRKESAAVSDMQANVDSLGRRLRADRAKAAADHTDSYLDFLRTTRQKLTPTPVAQSSAPVETQTTTEIEQNILPREPANRTARNKKAPDNTAPRSAATIQQVQANVAAGSVKATGRNRIRIETIQTAARRLMRRLGEGGTVGTSRFGNVQGAAGYHYNAQRYLEVRPKYANMLDVTFHEIGHAVQERLGLESNAQMIQSWQNTFRATAAYDPSQYDHEAFAEFFWRYVSNRDLAVSYAGDTFVNTFESMMRDRGLWKDTSSIIESVRAFQMADTNTKIGATIVDASRSDNRTAHEKEIAFIAKHIDRTAAGELMDSLAREKLGRDKPLALELSVANAARLSQRSQSFSGACLTGESIVDQHGDIRRYADGTAMKSLQGEFQDAGLNGKDFDEFTNYLVLQQALDHMTERDYTFGVDDQGQPVKHKTKTHSVLDIDLYDADTGALSHKGAFSLDEIRAELARARQAHPEFELASAGLQRWWNNMMTTYMGDTGFLRQDTIDLMQAMYPHYVPLQRERNGSAGRSGDAGASFKVHTMRGSTQNIINPIDSLVSHVNAMVSQATANELKLAAARSYDAISNASGWGEDGPGGALYMREIYGAGKPASAIIDEASGDPLGGVINARAMGQEGLASTNGGDVDTITVVNPDGSTRVFEVTNPELFRLLSGMPAEQAGAVFTKLGYATRFMAQLTTGGNPYFALRNAMRDYQTSVNYGSWAASYLTGLPKWAKTFAEVWRATSEGRLYKESADFSEFAAQGGVENTRYKAGDAVSNEEYRNELFGSYKDELGHKHRGYETTSAKRKAAELASRAWSAVTLERLNEVVELTSRFVEYKYGQYDRSTQEGRNQAFLGSRDVTVDFGRAGYGGLAADMRKIVPFYNASLQGIYRNVRQLSEAERASGRWKTRLIKNVLNAAAASALSSLAILHFADDDTKENFYYLSNQLKASHMYLPNFAPDVLGPSKLIRIPIEQNPLTAAIHAAVTDAVWGTGPDDEWAITMAAMAEQILDNINPVGSLITDPAVSLLTNKNWYGSHIVPTYMENYDPSQQYTEDTAAPFVGASELMHRAGIEVSPMHLQYLAEQYTGFLGQVAIPAMPNEKGTDSPVNAAVAKLRKTLTSDPLISNDIVSRVYSNYNTLNSIKTTGNAGKKLTGLRAGMSTYEAESAVQDAKALTSKGGAIYDAKKEITALYGQINEIEARPGLSTVEKYRLQEPLRAEMVDIALRANEEMARYEERYIKGAGLLTQWFGSYARIREDDDE